MYIYIANIAAGFPNKVSQVKSLAQIPGISEKSTIIQPILSLQL